MDRCYHWFEVERLVNDSPILHHCLGPEDESCWCNPDILTECPDCDNEPSEDGPVGEGWQQYCDRCGNYGLVDVSEVEDLSDDDPLIIVHKDI